MNRNKLIISVVFCIIFSLMLLGLPGLAQEKETYVNGIDPAYPPYAYVDEQGNPAGFDVEALDWIAEEMGFEVVHQPTAWDGIVSSLLANKIDMIYSGMSITEERKQKVNFSIPYKIIDQAICVPIDSDLNAIAAFMGDNVVGTQRGCTAAMWIEDNLVKTGLLPKEHLKLYDNFPLALQDLQNGRIDAGMMDDVAIKDAITQGMAIKIVGTIITGEGYGVAVRKEDTELLEIINEGLTRLMTSPKWEELKEKYPDA